MVLAIGVGVTGFELPALHLGGNGGGSQPAPLAGVQAVAASTLLRVGAGAPSGGELAFMAVEPGGNLVVSDARRRTVMRFDPTGHLLSEWGPAFGDASLDEPAGVAVRGNDFYVLDRGTPRIFRLDASGRLQSILNLERFGTYGLNGLATDLGGNLFIADTGRNRILVLAPDGALVRQIGHSGTDLGGLTQPMMLAFAGDGSFVVADWENTRLERWDANFEATEFWSTASHPFGVAIDQIGRIYVPDTDHRRVQAYSPQGALLGELGAAGSPPIEIVPKQVALARSDRPSLYVLGADGLVRLDLENTAPPPQGGTSDLDVLSLVVIGLLVAMVALAIFSRRARPRLALVGATLDRPVRLEAENGAQRQHQQARAHEHLLIPDQAKGEQEATREQHDTEQDAEAKHYV